jgi:hypothetical protein
VGNALGQRALLRGGADQPGPDHSQTAHPAIKRLFKLPDFGRLVKSNSVEAYGPPSRGLGSRMTNISRLNLRILVWRVWTKPFIWAALTCKNEKSGIFNKTILAFILRSFIEPFREFLRSVLPDDHSHYLN